MDEPLPDPPIPDNFPPKAVFWIDDDEPVVWLPDRGLNCVGGSGLLHAIPDSEFFSESSILGSQRWTLAGTDGGGKRVLMR